MKRRFKIVILIILCLLLCGLIVFTIHYNHLVWLQEYNKQIDVLGYYKEDIHLLDQHFEYIKISLLIRLDILIGVVLTVWGINIIVED